MESVSLEAMAGTGPEGCRGCRYSMESALKQDIGFLGSLFRSVPLFARTHDFGDADALRFDLVIEVHR